MKHYWIYVGIILIVATGLSGCATSRVSIDDEAVYRAQDRAFRPMGE